MLALLAVLRHVAVGAHLEVESVAHLELEVESVGAHLEVEAPTTTVRMPVARALVQMAGSPK